MEDLEVKILYFDGCPNVEPTAELVSDVMKELDITAPARLQEIEDEANAREAHFLGSPTVQVNGKDIEKERRNDSPLFGCRIYSHGNRKGGVPSRDLIRTALTEALNHDQE